MAVRLYSEFKSDQGDQYKIEIHDTQWAAASTTFNVDSRGFELTYEGETDDIVSPIVSSRLTFGAYATDNTFETFIDTLKLFQENRFRVVVYRSETITGRNVDNGLVMQSLLTNEGDTEYQLFWIGWLTQDLVSVEDASAPYIYEITATDGIGRLANVEYDEANTIIETNGLQLTRVTDVLKNALTNIGTADLWGASDVFFETAVDWWETNAQTYSTSVDPAVNQAFDVRYFNERDDDGNVVYPSTLEILRQMATLYNARIFMQRGRFVFEQYGNRDTSSRYVSRYTKTASAISRTLVSDDVVFDQTLYGARRSGNNWNFLPAAQTAKIHYVQRFLNPFNAFGLFRFRVSPNSYTAGFIAGGSGVQLGMGTAEFNVKIVGAASLTAPIFPVFKMRIRIKDSSTGTFYYCNRSYNGVATGGAMFGIPAWSTTAGEYYFDLPAFFTSGIAVVKYPVRIITPDIPVNGELDFQLQLHGVFRSSNGSAYTPSQPVLFDTTFVFDISTDGATNAPGATFSSVNAEAGIDSRLTIDLGDVVIADGPLQSGHLAAYNGSAWIGTQDWRKGSSGTALPILKLLSNETLALHVRPIEQYNGNAIYAFDFGQRIVFDSDAYLMTSGTYTANNDEWNGTWYKIQTIRASVSAIDPVDDLVERSTLNSATTSGVSPNDIVGGRIGGMVVDIENKKVGPFEQTATGGKIGGTLDVTGNAVFDANVQVDGDTTIVGTIDVTDLEVSNDLDVTGSTTLGGLSAGTTTLGASTISSASVTGNQTIGGTLGVTGKSTLGTLEAGTSTLGASTLSSASVTGNTSVGGTLGVTGTSTLGTLNAAATSVTTLAASSNTTIGGTLGVTGTSTLGTLNASATSVTTLAASSNTTIGGTLGVTGKSTLGTLEAGTSTLGASTIGSAVVTGETELIGATRIVESLQVDRTASFTQGVNVGGGDGIVTNGLVFGLDVNAFLMNVIGPSKIDGTLNVAAAATIGSELNVGGTSRLADITATDASLSTLETSGAATIGQTLDVVGRTSTQYVQLDTDFVPNGEPAGAFYWDPDGGIAAVRGIDGVSLDLNEKEIWFVKNQSGSSIAAGSAVYAAGTLGASGQLLIAKMIANGTINAKYYLGITQSTIANGADGYVVRVGKIKGLNTTAWNDGDVLYVDETTAGALSDTEPTAPNLKLPTAFVVHSAANGTIAVRQTAGTYLYESHDVQIASAATNEVLARTSSGRWENKTIDSLLSTSDATPAETDQSTFDRVYGGTGTMMGDPASWMPITIGGVNYLMPLYLAP